MQFIIVKKYVELGTISSNWSKTFKSVLFTTKMLRKHFVIVIADENFSMSKLNVVIII